MRAFCFSVALVCACEPEVGSPCDPDDEFVAQALGQPTREQNRLVRDVRFDNCSQALCGAVDDSRGFCTIACASDGECPSDGFVCAPIVRFGPLGCTDFSDETDCLTETDPRSGEPALSRHPRTFCTASPDAIRARDVQSGRL
jgi:hypothetical protein